MIRAQLFSAGSGFLTEHLFNVVITGHGLVIVFFMAMPIAIGGFGNWLIPLFCGRKDIVFPRLNNLSFWLVPFSFAFLVFSMVLEGVGTG